MNIPQIFAYGMISGAAIVALLWWARTRRKPRVEDLADETREEAERQRELALLRAEDAELQADQHRATAGMYERRIERLTGE